MSLNCSPSSSEHWNVLAGQESSRLKIWDAAGMYVAAAGAATMSWAEVEPATRPNHSQLRLRHSMVAVGVEDEASADWLAGERQTGRRRWAGWAESFSDVLQVVQACERWVGWQKNAQSGSSLLFFLCFVFSSERATGLPVGDLGQCRWGRLRMLVPSCHGRAWLCRPTDTADHLYSLQQHTARAWEPGLEKAWDDVIGG
ncbi:hypothetical protein NM208_g16381 [Fusarium decemcellulare]|uniref:Uncharacterized protein n=1 Tax=Fusarium decemcellulare TaxID=57161 RepID=A0ACC1RC86_9HYPO|nr:hypothetical protein NM208_g16381 [Fusarium decemcellulare]